MRAVIERQVTQLTRLVDDLMDVSPLSTGILQLQRADFTLGGVVDRAVESVDHLIEQRKHEFTLSIPAEPIRLHADAARVEQSRRAATARCACAIRESESHRPFCRASSISS